MRGIRITVLTIMMSTVLSACGGNYGGSGAIGAGVQNGTDPTTTTTATFANDKAFYDGKVKDNLGVCRTCHLSNGTANLEGQTGRRFVLADDAANDYDSLKTSWIALGKGVETNYLLQKPSLQISHSGGQQWPKDSLAYHSMKILLGCWDNPVGCAALLGNETTDGTTVPEPLALLGNPGKHYFVSEICDAPGATDDTTIDWNQDPRRLMLQSSGHIDNDSYAVYFNDPFEICHTDTLFKNQAAQNALRVAKGQKPIHTAKPYAKTCGEWRARVKEGHDWIAMWPTDTACGKEGLPSCGAEGNSPVGLLAGKSTSDGWNKLWQIWGLTERPVNFDEQVVQRYGHSTTPAHIKNPYPIIDAAKGIDETKLLSKDFGGTGHLPLGWAQGRDATGKYSGQLGLTCFSCHAGQIGAGEVAGRDGMGPNNSKSYGANPFGSYMGLPNTNTELGVLLADLIHAQQPANLNVPALGYIPVVNTTRGTNAADTEIEAIVAIRDFDTLNFQHVFADPAHPSYGDQDPPAWWWLHNKSRYLWFGGHSTDSSRGNMYFGSVNGLTGDQVLQNEGIFESVHDWSLTVEAPDYPQGYCTNADGTAVQNAKPNCINRNLAEQGAILFHEKNLWADGKNADIPKPHGNGACAGCHGVYSPRYAHDTRFLPDPKMIGENSYTVPLEIIKTDPAQAEGWSKEVRPHVSTFWWSYPDAQANYLFPENKDPLTEFLDDYAITDGITGANLADHLGRQGNNTGAGQPISDALAQVTGQLSPITGLPLGAAMGRVKGACSFEEKTVGYVTPPLHGVWASAPYFHNASVPTVWEVLKPSDRKPVWKRKSTITPNMTVNAFEHELTGVNGAYDFEHLGWQYQEVKCSDGGNGIPYYTCSQDPPIPPEIDWVKTALDGGLLWPTWVVPPPVAAQGLEDRKIYNTNLYSKKNTGHEWTKVLTDGERKAILEYLKTL